MIKLFSIGAVLLLALQLVGQLSLSSCTPAVCALINSTSAATCSRTSDTSLAINRSNISVIDGVDALAPCSECLDTVESLSVLTQERRVDSADSQCTRLRDVQMTAFLAVEVKHPPTAYSGPPAVLRRLRSVILII